jgi:hypothetical protein
VVPALMRRWRLVQVPQQRNIRLKNAWEKNAQISRTAFIRLCLYCFASCSVLSLACRAHKPSFFPWWVPLLKGLHRYAGCFVWVKVQ